MVFILFATILFVIFPALALARELPARAIFSNKSQYLDAHNQFRAQHNAASLSWSESLAGMAENWANQCKFESSNQSLRSERYGENIAAGTGKFSVNSFLDWIVNEGYDSSEPLYNHFTQLVWKSTTEVGCASNKCDGIFDPKYGKVTLHVCLYNPAGNIIGEAPENVSPACHLRSATPNSWR